MKKKKNTIVSKEWGRDRERERQGEEREGERGTDRSILPVPLYFQSSVKMNFTS